MNENLVKELTKLLGLQLADVAHIRAEYGVDAGYIEADWHEALNRVGDSRRPTLGQFEAHMLRLKRARSGQGKAAKVNVPSGPHIFPTRCTWQGRPVYETNERPMSKWTLVTPQGDIEQYLSTRFPTAWECQHDQIADGPRAGYQLLKHDLVLRAGIYGRDDDWQELPADWRTRPECQALPGPRKLSDTLGFTRLKALL